MNEPTDLDIIKLEQRVYVHGQLIKAYHKHTQEQDAKINNMMVRIKALEAKQ